MERIGQANVSSERSVRLTLDNLTVPRFAKKRLGFEVVVLFSRNGTENGRVEGGRGCFEYVLPFPTGSY